MPEDDAIKGLCLDKGIECYRGDSIDVLSRFLAVAETLEKEDTIVRVTADNPINNHKVSEIVFNHHLESNNDYTYVEAYHLCLRIHQSRSSFKIKKCGRFNG